MIRIIKIRKCKKIRLTNNPTQIIMQDIIKYLKDLVINREYFPTYEQLLYDSKEVIGLLEPHYRKFVDRLKSKGEILKYQDHKIERLYPIPKTRLMINKIKKILIKYSKK